MLNSDPSKAKAGNDPSQTPQWLEDRLTAEPENWALFLDIDGTLIDLAPSPDEIVVPPDLPGNLKSISDRLGGALALVTGRGLPYADQLFQPYQFPIAGLHGSECRLADGSVHRIAATDAFDEVKNALRAAAGRWPGVLIEDKGAAVAAHYRQAPEHRTEVEEAMEYYLLQAGPDFTLQRGKKKATVYFQKLVREPSNNIYVLPSDTIYVYREPHAFMAFGASGGEEIGSGFTGMRAM